MTKDQFVMDENGTHWRRPAHVHGTLCDLDEAWQERCPEQVADALLQWTARPRDIQRMPDGSLQVRRAEVSVDGKFIGYRDILVRADGDVLFGDPGGWPPQ